MMKYFVLLCAAAAIARSADFTTGQAARLVIGQQTFTAQEEGASDRLLGAASGVAVANDTLFVVDSNRVGSAPQNNRVLIFPNLSVNLPAPTAELPKDSQVRCQVCLGVASVAIGQPDFTKTDIALTQSGFRQPTAVASNGRILAIADTDNNRILIWNSIPFLSGTPADVVVGQNDFKTATANMGSGNTPNSKGLRGPQGVWLQAGKLYVADTQNHRVLVWNQVPTANGQAADLVLGQPNFTTFVEPDLTKAVVDARANTMLNPVSVTSDGTRLYVTDLGHNRVLIWNTIPTQNQAPADIVVGQPSLGDGTTNVTLENNSSLLCASNGTDATDATKLLYPERCAATLNFPRFALSDGKRLFVADGGNNRVLVYNNVPTTNGQRADIILGQPDEFASVDSIDLLTSSADSLRTPMSLAWDGTNLFVGDTFNRRIMIFTVGDTAVNRTAVRNAASQEIFAVGSVAVSGAIKENDVGTVTIQGVDYKYTVLKDDTVTKIVLGLVAVINAGNGDPLVFARANPNFNSVILTARKAGEDGNAITLAVTLSDSAQLILTASGATLNGGQDAAKIAPGTLINILGENLTSSTVTAPDGPVLPKTLGGVQVYVDGLRVPLLMVSPTLINAQMPFEISDVSSVSIYVRTTDASGTVRVTTAVGAPIIQQNPGIFALDGTDPRTAIAVHSSSYATGVVSVDGTPTAGDVATIKIEDRAYSYTVVTDDTLQIVRDRLIEQINQDERVIAYPAGMFTRIRLQAKIPGPAGEGIAYSASVNDTATVILSPLSPTLCCSNKAGAPITEANPAVPGETISVYATGLGLIFSDDGSAYAETGSKYAGPLINQPNSPVDSLLGGKTANVLFAGLKQGSVGIYEVQLQLNSDLPTNSLTQLTIAQDVYISNIVTIPVYNPNPPVQ
ncbi:MAG: hypothetical protein ABJF23_22785 [Bryobacteraceae bacterium]